MHVLDAWLLCARTQAAAGQQSAAWAEAERSLQDRLRHAETAAASASGQAARLGLELEQTKQSLAGATEQLAEARAALSEAQQALDVERQRRATAETTAGHLRSDLASAQESLNTLEKVRGAQQLRLISWHMLLPLAVCHVDVHCRACLWCCIVQPAAGSPPCNPYSRALLVALCRCMHSR